MFEFSRLTNLNIWFRLVSMTIKRTIFNKLYDDHSEREASILVGPRQVGKTTLMRQLEKKAQSDGLATHFFDLEQPDNLTRFNTSDSTIITMLEQSGDIVFIDEFHYIKNASKIFKALHDKRSKTKIYASGSSALEIHTHLKESLAGRKFIYPIHPCSLAEIHQAVSDDPFEYCCLYGGMPGTVHHKDPNRKQQILTDILQSYLLKDIKALVRDENLRAFNHLLYLLAQSQGNLVVVDNLSRDVGLSSHTINTYLDIMEQTYVNFAIHSYSRNLGSELKKSKKYYLYDIGIRNSLLKNFAALSERADAGAIVETFVFLELQRQLTPESEIRFWRLKSGDEVDFLWIRNQIPYPVETKLNWESGKIPGGLTAFLKRYPDTTQAFVVSSRGGKSIQYNTTLIQFLPFQDASLIPAMVGKTPCQQL